MYLVFQHVSRNRNDDTAFYRHMVLQAFSNYAKGDFSNYIGCGLKQHVAHLERFISLEKAE